MAPPVAVKEAAVDVSDVLSVEAAEAVAEAAVFAVSAEAQPAGTVRQPVRKSRLIYLCFMISSTGYFSRRHYSDRHV